MTPISLFRRNLLRSGYLLMFAGLGLTLWPSLLDPGHVFSLKQGVIASLLGAIGLLAGLGLRYPMQMLPLMFVEVTWKLIWLTRMAAPRWWAGTMDAAMAETAVECLLIVVVIAVIPWDHVVENYASRPAEPWRPERALAR
jgi:hypothetical protein